MTHFAQGAEGLMIEKKPFTLMDLMEACVWLLNNGVPGNTRVSIHDPGDWVDQISIEAPHETIHTMGGPSTVIVGEKEVVIR